jgi:hypothetical protein
MSNDLINFCLFFSYGASLAVCGRSVGIVGACGLKPRSLFLIFDASVRGGRVSPPKYVIFMSCMS